MKGVRWVLLLLCSLAAAQMSTLPAADAIAHFPGPPPVPPIFSQMTVILQGELQFQNTAKAKGPVASILREETWPLQKTPKRTSKFEFDHDGRLTKAIYEDGLGSTTTSNVWQNGRLQSQTVHHHRADGKMADWEEWQHWNYDRYGRLSEFHAGRDKAEWNYYLNFKYDAADRSLGYEYRDTKIGGLPTYTEITYGEKDITLRRLDYSRHKLYEQVEVVDRKNQVTDLKVSDLSGGQLKPWYHVRFKYDEMSRLIEQDTDPFKLGSGDDYSPLPGKVIIEYNDDKHSGEQKYFDTEGKLVVHTTFSLDRDGLVTSLSALDASGKELPSGESFFDSASHKVSKRPGKVEWEVIYDERGNWTERRRWFTPADRSSRIMTRLVRQTITYR